MGGEDGEAGVVEPGQRHQREVVVALAADLVAVGDRRLVAVVAVGDQQLRVGEQLADRGVNRGVADPPDPGHGAAGIGGFAPRLLRLDRGRHQRPWVLGAEREDRREVVAGGAGQVEPVLLRPRQGALVGQDLARLEVLDPDPGEDAVAGAGGAVGSAVVLRHRPDRRLGVVDQGAGLAPGLHRLGGPRVGVVVRLLRSGLPVRFRQVDRDRVVGGARQQLRPLRRVDHVVGRRRDPVQRSDDIEVVVGGEDRAHVGHRRGS